MKDVTVIHSKTIHYSDSNQRKSYGWFLKPYPSCEFRIDMYPKTIPFAVQQGHASIDDFSARLRVINRSQQFAGCGITDATVAADQKESASVI